MPGSRTNRRTITLQLLVGAVVLAAGAMEARFGRAELFGDDISYLDVANSLHGHDWRAALNPMWSIGYPALLTCVKPFFPSTIEGELNAVFTLNLLIFVAAWLSFLHFLYVAEAFRTSHVNRLHRPGWGLESRPAAIIAAACLFTVTSIAFGRVSSIGPDLLVACLFFLASALVLRFTMEPITRNGTLLGLILGLGFITKAVFLPLSVILLGTALIPRRRLRPIVALSAPITLFTLMLPYAAGLSWAIGRPTIGESGALNYAFHVNKLPHWMGWQQGPPPLRHALHPVHLLREHPAVFGFGEPFHVTYPPQFAMHYWYDGYKHFFSPINALRALATNLHELEKVLHEDWPFSLALVLCAFIQIEPSFPGSRSLRIGLSGNRKAFPLWLPSLLGIALYVQVHLEARYIAPFIAILAALIFLTPLRRPRLTLAILIIGTSLTLYPHLKPSRRSPQWQMAAFLTQSGLKPGDPVASVSTLNDIRCTWAYAARLHIVADIGNDAYTPQDQQADFNAFWRDPAIQSDVLRLFRDQGAVAVIVPHAPGPALSPLWTAIPGTDAFLLRLP